MPCHSLCKVRPLTLLSTLRAECHSVHGGGKKRRFNAAKQRQRSRKADMLMRRRQGALSLMLDRGSGGTGGAGGLHSRSSGAVVVPLRACADGGEGAPKIVAFLPYASNTDCEAVRAALLAQAQVVATTPSAPVREVAGWLVRPSACLTVCVSRRARARGQTLGNPITAGFASYKQRMTLMVAPDRDLTRCLSIARVADVVVYVANMKDGEDMCIDEVRECIARLPAVRRALSPVLASHCTYRRRHHHHRSATT